MHTRTQENGPRALLEAARPLIELAIAEDVGPGDVTSESVLPPDRTLYGRIRAKQDGVIAGLPIAEAVFARIDPALRFTAHVQDGERVTPGDLVATVCGPARTMLAAERLALNFLQQLSGVATLARAFVDAVAGTGATILDTRKTHPGWRALEKYAVRMGGAQNHRMGLYDMLLVKDNHIEAAGSIPAAVERARAAHPDLPVEVEVKDLQELEQALALDVDRIMLDNMDVEGMRAAVERAGGRTPLEASGGVSLDDAAAIAATGVDFISVGALTHSAPALDLSMKIENQSPPGAGEPFGERICRLKEQLGDELVILAHHYQRDSVIRFADRCGDSLKLARDTAGLPDARYVVFCGVHFMAETAAILSRPGQRVFLPDREAGCALADTARLSQVEAVWARLNEVVDAEAEFTPVTYVNSTAALKAFCGRHGGIVCTSSNAEGVLRWALERRPRVFFFPDQHLGRNTAFRMGIPEEEMLLVDPHRPPSVHGAETLHRARILLWGGACNVHQCFLPEHVLAWRERMPEARIIVHPECSAEVVRLADEAGSTSYIIRCIDESPPGAQWVIGTESNLVHRLRQEHPEQFIDSLSPQPVRCQTMNQITPAKLARVLQGLVDGEGIEPVTVPDDVAQDARVALERMLEVGK
jgi:quinolinate synthase